MRELSPLLVGGIITMADREMWARGVEPYHVAREVCWYCQSAKDWYAGDTYESRRIYPPVPDSGELSMEQPCDGFWADWARATVLVLAWLKRESGCSADTLVSVCGSCTAPAWNAMEDMERYMMMAVCAGYGMMGNRQTGRHLWGLQAANVLAYRALDTLFGLALAAGAPIERLLENVMNFAHESRLFARVGEEVEGGGDYVGDGD